MNKQTIMVLAMSALVVAGCASTDETTSEEKPLTVAEILENTLDEEAYGPTSRCLRNHLIDRMEVLDEQHVLVWGRRDQAWLNTLSTRCIGLRRHDALRLETHGSQLCKLDTVSSIDLSSAAAVRTSARCALGEFRQITHEQAKLLKEELKR